MDTEAKIQRFLEKYRDINVSIVFTRKNKLHLVIIRINLPATPKEWVAIDQTKSLALDAVLELACSELDRLQLHL